MGKLLSAILLLRPTHLNIQNKDSTARILVRTMYLLRPPGVLPVINLLTLPYNAEQRDDTKLGEE
jgi:hypothetical protein